jgi:DNA invertase Pin-like site-specific DNA recombinase
MDIIEMKKCNTCLIDKELSCFYTYKVKDGKRYENKCKSCKQPPKVKKPRGFDALDPEIRDKIMELLKDRSNSNAYIARKFHIKTSTFAYWVPRLLKKEPISS